MYLYPELSVCISFFLSFSFPSSFLLFHISPPFPFHSPPPILSSSSFFPFIFPSNSLILFFKNWSH